MYDTLFIENVLLTKLLITKYETPSYILIRGTTHLFSFL